MVKEDYRNIEEAILQNEETIKRTVKQRKSKKFNFLKYKPVNQNIIWPNETVVQQGKSKLINHPQITPQLELVGDQLCKKN